MNLATIEMDRTQAREAFLEYRTAVKERHSDEDEAIMRGYRELARGRQLIRLSDTVLAGGLVERTWRPSWDRGRAPETVMLPAIAVMRADRPECWVSRDGNDRFVFTPDTWYRGRKDRVVIGGFEPHQMFGQWRAMVPIVPPALRPKAALRNYHILWEANWAQANPPAPHDPALLRHIGGDLYAVLAVWDLTEVERAVLGMRA